MAGQIQRNPWLENELARQIAYFDFREIDAEAHATNPLSDPVVLIEVKGGPGDVVVRTAGSGTDYRTYPALVGDKIPAQITHLHTDRTATGLIGWSIKPAPGEAVNVG
jgi:hypothetical protein